MAIDLSPLIDSLYVVFGAMLGFLSFVWSAKQLLSFVGINDIGLRVEARKQIQREDRQRKIREYKQQIRDEQAQKKAQKLEKQQQVQQKQDVLKKSQETFKALKQVEKNTPLSQRIEKTKTAKHSSNGKRTKREYHQYLNDDKFMSKRYRELELSGAFEKGKLS